MQAESRLSWTVLIAMRVRCPAAAALAATADPFTMEYQLE